MTSTGILRRLSTLSTDGGIFTILAVDHRDSMRQVLDPLHPENVDASTLTALKLDLISAVGSRASAVLVDPEYSVAPAIHARALSGTVGFIAAIEQQGYLGDPTATATTLLPDWGVAKAARAGASGVKLLVLYDPYGGTVTDHQDDLIRTVIGECRRSETPLFLEPLVPAAAMPATSTDSPRRRIVIETVRRLGALGPDVLKVQFPLDVNHTSDQSEWGDACTELTETAPVPWALLSGGDPFDSFAAQLRVACRNGASGFLVGRALWREAALAPNRQQVIADTVLARFEQLASIARTEGRPWFDAVETPQPAADWYRTY